MYVSQITPKVQSQTIIPQQTAYVPVQPQKYVLVPQPLPIAAPVNQIQLTIPIIPPPQPVPSTPPIPYETFIPPTPSLNKEIPKIYQYYKYVPVVEQQQIVQTTQPSVPVYQTITTPVTPNIDYSVAV